MSNRPRDYQPVEALRRLDELCRETLEQVGGDRPGSFALVQARLDALPPGERARIEAALDRILGFRPPASRSIQ